jgi:hypothetical protein
MAHAVIYHMNLREFLFLRRIKAKISRLEENLETSELDRLSNYLGKSITHEREDSSRGRQIGFLKFIEEY